MDQRAAAELDELTRLGLDRGLEGRARRRSGQTERDRAHQDGEIDTDLVTVGGLHYATEA